MKCLGSELVLKRRLPSRRSQAGLQRGDPKAYALTLRYTCSDVPDEIARTRASPYLARVVIDAAPRERDTRAARNRRPDIDRVDHDRRLRDPKCQAETWHDMLRLQDSGVYPARFASIHCPVLMLHGSYDPHPGPMVRDSLKPYIPQLEYREFGHCGHSPWIEEHARDRFLEELRSWLEQQLRP